MIRNLKMQGFTLIELMIVVAIIAILAAIALPAYQDYLIRSQVSEGAVLADGAKTAVAEFYSNRGVFPTNNDSAGLSPPGSISGKYVATVSVSGLGVITSAYASGTPREANAKIDGKALAFVPTDNLGSVTWDCRTAATTVDAKYLPSACRAP